MNILQIISAVLLLATAVAAYGGIQAPCGCGMGKRGEGESDSLVASDEGNLTADGLDADQIIIGDQVFDKSAQENLEARNYGTRVSMSEDIYGMWPGGIVNYYLESDVASYRKLIGDSLRNMQNAVGDCVQFNELRSKPADQMKTPYLKVYSGSGCFSRVGFSAGKEGYVSLNVKGCMNEPTIQHEFMHTLGFEHEHNHPDRDNHIKVNWKYLSGSQCESFKKCMGCIDDGFPFDIESVLQYSTGGTNPACRKSGESDPGRMVKMDGSRIQMGRHVSALDVKKIQKRYKCTKRGNKYVSGIPKEAVAEVHCQVDDRSGPIYNSEISSHQGMNWLQKSDKQKFIDDLVKKLNSGATKPHCQWTVTSLGPANPPEASREQYSSWGGYMTSYRGVRGQKIINALSTTKIGKNDPRAIGPLRKALKDIENKTKDRKFCAEMQAAAEKRFRGKSSDTQTAVYTFGNPLIKFIMPASDPMAKYQGFLKGLSITGAPKARNMAVGGQTVFHETLRDYCHPDIELVAMVVAQ